LLAQFLTITPVLLIVFAGEQQRRASDGYVSLLDGLDRLSFAIANLENIPPVGVKAPAGVKGEEKSASAAWRQQYSDYRDDLNRVLAASAPAPQVRETLARVDSIVTRMANTESELADLNKRPEQAGPLAAGLHKDGRAARSELLNAQRSVRLELSTTGDSIAQKTTYLKALVAGACLLAFGVVFVVRRFRVDAAIQSKLQRELRTANEEVITALAVARSESEAKNQFLTHVGRLMRTPLNAIVDGTGELLQTDLTGRQRGCAQATLELAESLIRVAGQVVDYSRMESGRFELQSREFDPSRVVTDVLQLFIPLAERKGLRLKSSIKKGLPSAVKGDPKRLRQVLVNLLSNAVRFTETGEISVRVEAAAGEEWTSLRFEVSDTGIGITEEVRNRIFQPFGLFQPINPANGSITDGNQGSGLSLAISKKLVELMGGKIDIASEPDRGSTFSFTAVFESVRAGAEPQPEANQAVASTTDSIAAAGVGAILTVSPKPRSEKKERPDRRAEHRHGTNYPTLLRAESAGIAVIRVLDVSPSGLRLSVPFRLLPRTEVEIRIEGTSVVGVVRNCTRIAPNEFHVGIQIPWEASADDQERLNHLHLLRIELT
jgi:signal transduction histidine kinase